MFPSIYQIINLVPCKPCNNTSYNGGSAKYNMKKSKNNISFIACKENILIKGK